MLATKSLLGVLLIPTLSNSFIPSQNLLLRHHHSQIFEQEIEDVNELSENVPLLNDQFDNTNDMLEGLKNFFCEVDNFVDDAFGRRLGNGANFYGKRKSNFYGESDRNRKVDPKKPDPLEDYQGPLSGGRFLWKEDENGHLHPVTRMKKTNIGRMHLWEKYFDDEDNQSL